MLTKSWSGLLLLITCVSLSACSFAPDYEQPVMDMPAEWRAVNMDTVPLQQDWWTRFDDPVLTALIEEALKNNQDLEEALAKVDSAAAQVGQSRSVLFPTITGTAGASMSSTSLDGPNMSIQRPEYESGLLERATSTYQGAIGASWELDLWGKYRNSYTALSDVLLSTAVGYSGLRLMVAGQTAQNYFTLLSLDMQMETARRTLKTREEGLVIYTTRYKQGDITELDWLRAKSEVETARASMLSTMVQTNTAEASLAVLVGRSPRQIMEKAMQRGTPIEKMKAPPVLPAGLPSELLARRPDIRAAEYMVMAYNANIGAVRAEFFPSISLTGSLGTLSQQTLNLFTGPAGAWSYGASASVPLLDFGRTWYKVEDAEALKRQSIAVYRKTVQTAFQDIRTALMAQRQANGIVRSIQAQVDNMRRASELARLQYDNGYTDYLTVLDAERQLFSVEIQLATAMSDRLNAVVAVCMALGGGWDENAALATAATAGSSAQ